MQSQAQEHSNLKRKGPYPSSQQMRRLLEHLDSDAELRNGKFSCNFTRKEAVRRWQIIAESVNSIPGARKSWLEWRKTYSDKKTKAKKKAADIRRSAQRVTGGGSPPPLLDDNEEFLLGSISEASLIGLPSSQESVAVLELPFDAAATQSEPLPSTSKEPVTVLELPTTCIVAAQRVPSPTTSMEPVTVVDTFIRETMVPETNSSQSSITIPHSSYNISVDRNKRKTVAQKRLQRSVETAAALEKTLKEKNSIKKEFYLAFIEQMKLQTAAMKSLAESLEKIASKK